MRIIAGRLRGRPLVAPEGRTTRPITDRVKESLFNVLGSRFGAPGQLPPLDVLDLFAGSGALGIEALSRGARSCVFVERDPRSLRTLRGNIQSLHIGAQSRIVAENAWTLRSELLSEAGFGLAFVDPPYRDAEDGLKVADLIDRVVLSLAPDGLIVFRSEAATTQSLDALRNTRVLDQRIYGRMRIVLLARAE
jgi:16S rRNA (guanine966-N2)-methyltransferase